MKVENISLELVLIFTVLILMMIIFYLLFRLTNKEEKKGENWTLRMIQEQLLHLTKNVDYKLSESSRNTMKQASMNADISKRATDKIEEITKKLSSLEETNKKIQDIGWQLEWLESILKNPKQRGVLWEYFLENALKNTLPPENYKIQYQFQDNSIVDAALFVKEKIIPIDSKFSLENYNRVLSGVSSSEKELYAKKFTKDLKKRIDETSKYIKPEEGTMDFAFMFIPSEWVYYDLLINKVGSFSSSSVDLVEYAFTEKKVIIVSPTSFYAYLQTVLQWLRALQIEEKTKEIQKQVEKLRRHITDYEIYLEKIGNALSTTVNHYNTAYKKFSLIEKDILKISDEERLSQVQTKILQRPEK